MNSNNNNNYHYFYYWQRRGSERVGKEENKKGKGEKERDIFVCILCIY